LPQWQGCAPRRRRVGGLFGGEEQLPQAQEAIEAIESELEELMGLKDAALVCAAAMSARLAALKQTGGRAR
jgi:hypothetical protein